MYLRLVTLLFALALLPLASDSARAQEQAEAPQVAAVEPASGEAKVSVLVEPTVVFDREVTADAVGLVLRGSDDRPVDGRVALGADGRTVTFVPARPLARGDNYVLEIAGPAEPEVVTFTTDPNPPRRHRIYWGAHLESYRAYDVDTRGRVVAIASVVGPGPDGAWLTDDDDRVWMERRSYAPDGRLLAATRAIGAGADGRWATDDDDIAWLQRWSGDRAGGSVRVTYDGPGPDGSWLTGGDHIAEVLRIESDASDRPVQELTFGHPGGDGAWFTDDDVLSHVVTYDYQGDALVGWRRIVGPGTDGDWNAGDHRLAYRARQTFDSAGHPDLTIVYIYPGGDGVWDTEDDTIGFVVDEDRTAAGLLERRTVYDGPGFDGEWLSGDDQVGSWIAFERDRDLVTRATTYDHPGSDQAWFTADDVPAIATSTDLDPAGNREAQLVLTDSGVHDLYGFYD